MTDCAFVGGRVRTASGDVADWLLTSDGAIAATGRGDAPAAARTVDLDGAVLLPSFCDAHVHLPATGLYARGMDFRGERRAAAIVDAFAQRVDAGDPVLFGGNFEDPLDEPLAASDLDRAVGERPALLARADMHSCVASSALVRALDLDGLEGVDRDDDGAPTGYLREQAAAAAWRWFDANLPAGAQRDAVEAAIERAYARGVTEVHEMFVAEWRGWGGLDALRASAAEAALDVLVYVATDDVERVAATGATRMGGDYFLDGSFGSHTAWMSEPYASAPPSGSPPTGISYRDDADLLELFRSAQRARMQFGVHAIGDAAIEQALRTWERVADEAGVDEVRALGHRIEHFECASDDHIARAARLGVRASVQPAFDLYWGGDDGLYARRIGAERALRMNRFRSMASAGLCVGAGSDSTVTPLDPFLQMTALRAHHVESERVDAAGALTMHTLGSRALAGASRAGAIEPGRPADLVAVDRDPLSTPTGELAATEVTGTWIAARRVWPPERAEHT
ncbi:MAG TPA: amidohydrolase family protein [Actinomycetota bacterium]|nr:amidohydrolase family protein [Actinomycetota bacterium]